MTRKARMILIALAIAAAVGTVAVVGRKPAAAPVASSTAPAASPAADRASLTVVPALPKERTWPVTLSASGAVTAWQEASISAETGGLRIVALHADVGSHVKKGQLLAELADATVRAEVSKAEATLASARASLRQAEANARRGQAVREAGSLSEQQIEQYEIAAQTAAASVEEQEASLASAKIKLQQTRIVAVDDGVVSSRTATLGTVVSAGTELFKMVRGGRVEWRAEVDANQLARLKKDMPARVTLPGGAKAEGRVRELAPTLDSETRLAFAYVDLPSQAPVRAGTYVNGTIALGEDKALTVPSSAITLRDGRSYVFEIDVKRAAVIQREVTTGRSEGDLVEITAGLKAGTPVVLRGGAFLNDGDAVRLGKEQS
jgi:RND family efflux transporter MFP subunit